MNKVRAVVYLAATVLMWIIAIRQPDALRILLAAAATAVTIWHIALNMKSSKDDDYGFMSSDEQDAREGG